MSASGGVGSTSRLRSDDNLALLTVPARHWEVESGLFQGLHSIDCVGTSTELPDGIGVAESWRSGANAVSTRFFNVENGNQDVPAQVRRFAAIRPSSGRSAGVGPLMGLRYSRATAEVDPINPRVTATFALTCPGAEVGDAVFASARADLGSNITTLGAYCAAQDVVTLKVANFGSLQSVVDANVWEIGIIRPGATGGVGPLSESILDVLLPSVQVPFDGRSTQLAVFPGARVGDLLLGSPNGNTSVNGSLMLTNLRVTAPDQITWTWGNMDTINNASTSPATWRVARLPQITIR